MVEALFSKPEDRGLCPGKVNKFLNLPNPSSHMMALRVTQPVTEMTRRSFWGVKALSSRIADNVTVICEPIF
jgi:hypothetical protein